MNDTSPERDPRRNPRIGDVLRSGSEQRMVMDEISVKRTFEISHIVFSSTSIGCESNAHETIARWLRWAKNAEVLHAAD